MRIYGSIEPPTKFSYEVAKKIINAKKYFMKDSNTLNNETAAEKLFIIYCNGNGSRKKNWWDDTWWLHQPIIDSTRLGINFLNDEVVVLCGTWDCLLDAENFGHFYDKNKIAVSRKSCTTYVNAGRIIKNLLSESEKKSNTRRKRAGWLITASSVGKKWKWEVSRIRPNFCSCKSFL